MTRTHFLTSMAFALLFSAIGCGDDSMGPMDEGDVPVVEEAEIQQEVNRPEAQQYLPPEAKQYLQNGGDASGGAAPSGQ